VAEASHDGGDGGLPWSSVFDPIANARALEQIQRRGVEASAELVERLVSLVDGARDDRAWDAGDPSSSAPRPGGVDVFGLWADVATRTLQAMARFSVPDAESPGTASPGAQGAPGPPTGGSPWVDVVTGHAHGTLAVPCDPAGDVVPAELWLHNPSERAVGPLRLSVGDLRRPDGAVVPPGAVKLDPQMLELAPRSSRGVSASVDGATLLPPGRYRGLLLADGADEVAVAVELTVPGGP
jgi:hypothetical protein